VLIGVGTFSPLASTGMSS